MDHVTNPARGAGLSVRRDRNDERRRSGALTAWLVAMSGVVALGMSAPRASATVPTPVTPTLRYGLDLPTAFAAYHGGYNSYTSDTAGNILFSTSVFPGYLLRGVPGGALTVVAGTGNPGYSGDGSQATAAQVDIPYAIKVGSDGSIYFVDGVVVRRIAPDGTIDHIAGKPNGSPTPAECLSQPALSFEGPAVCLYLGSVADLSVGSDGSVLTFESLYGFPGLPGLPTSPFVRSIKNGLATMVAQSSQDGSCSGIPGPVGSASLGQLSDIATGSDGTVYLATTCQSPTTGSVIEILAIDSAGAVSVVAGGGSTTLAEGVAATDGQFWWPPSLSTDATGHLYATFRNLLAATAEIWMVGADGALHLVAAGSGTSFTTGSSANSVAFRSAEAEPSGSFLLESADINTTALGRLADGTLTVLNAGTPWTEPLDGANAAGQYLSGAVAMGFDSSGDLFYSSGTSPVVRTISPTGVLTTRAGNGQPGTHIDGPATQSPLGRITDLSVDTHGNLAIATSNGVVRVSNSGDLTSATGGGLALAAERVVLGADGAIFTSESNWCPAFDCRFSTVKKAAASGLVTTIHTQPVTSGTDTTFSQITLSPTTGELSGATSTRDALWTLDPASGIASYSVKPTGVNLVAIDQAGTVFYESNGIYRVEPDGTSVLVGAPTQDFIAGAPSAMAIDPQGNVWVAVPGNFGVRLYSYVGLAAPLPPPPPSAPTGVGSGSQITVTLPSPSTGGTPVDAYEVQISTRADGLFSAPITGTCVPAIAVTESSCTITDLVPGSTYYLKLRALNAGSPSAWSPTSSAITVPAAGGRNFFAGRLLLADGTAIAGADVYLRPSGSQSLISASGTTDSFGRFRVRTDPGTYTAELLSNLLGGIWMRFTVDLTVGNFEEQLRFPATTALTLEVVDADSNPVAGASVVDYGQGGSAPVWVGGSAADVFYPSTTCGTTNTDGLCVITTWIGNQSPVWGVIAPNGATGYFRTPAINTANSPVQRVQLPRIRTVSGVIRDVASNPLSGVSLSLRSGGGSTLTAATGSSGQFQFTTNAGLGFLRLSGPDFEMTNEWMIDLNASDFQQEMTMPAQVQVAFHVTGNDGSPAVGYEVISDSVMQGSAPLWQGGPPMEFNIAHPKYCTTNSSGTCSITTYATVGASNWVVKQPVTNSTVHTFTLGAIPSAGPVDKAVQLSVPATARGRLITSTGAPIPNAFVQLLDPSAFNSAVVTTTTDANGEYAATTRPGHYAIRFWSGSYGLESQNIFDFGSSLAEVDLTQGDALIHDVVRPDVALLEVTVADEADNPLVGIPVLPPSPWGLPAGSDVVGVTLWPGGPTGDAVKQSGCTTNELGTCSSWVVVSTTPLTRTVQVPNGPHETFTVPAVESAAGTSATLRIGGGVRVKVQSAGMTSGYMSVFAPAGTSLRHLTNTPIEGNVVPNGDLTPTGALAYSATVANAGDSANLTLVLPAGTNPVGVFEVVNGVYSDFTSFSTVTGDTIVLHLVDGGQGDADGLANGVIADLMVPVITAHQLTVTRSMTGSASGSVSSDVGGLACGTTCSRSFRPGTSVTLTASAVAGSVFTGWSGGGCTGTGTCTITTNADSTVTASFAPATSPVTVSKAGTGTGTVTSGPTGINCGTTCSTNVAHGASITLAAVAATGSVFAGWTGAGCSGTGTCSVAVTAPTSVTATFNPAPATILPSAPGKPTVIASDGVLTVSWTVPSVGAPFTDFIVQRATSASGTYTNVTSGTCATHPSTSRTCTVTGLPNGKRYYFKVKAVNAIGTGPTSVASVGVKAVAVPGTVGALTCTKLITRAVVGSIRVRWTTAGTNGSAILRYEYSSKPSSSITWGSWTSNGKLRAITLTGLTKSVGYDVRVRAVNALGAGPASLCSATP